MSTLALLEATNNALDRLLRTFWAERALYLLAAVASFIVLGVLLVQAMRCGSASVEAIATVFASGGVISIGCFRISYFFKRGFDLVEVIVRQAASLNTQASAPTPPVQP